MKYIIAAGSDAGKDVVRDFVAGLDPDSAWEVNVKPYRKKKTHEQLGYYHGVVVAAFCEETGAEHDDMHEYLLGQFFGWVEYEVMGRKKVKPVRTLTSPGQIPREDFTKFIDWCIAFGGRKGILIPFPNEVIA